MKRGLPPPKANVDNVLPELIEQARMRRERNAARGRAEVPDDVEPGAQAAIPPAETVAGVTADASVRQLRDELRGLRWLLALALLGVAALVIKVFF